MIDTDTTDLAARMRRCNPWDDAPSGISEILDDAAYTIDRLTTERDDARALIDFNSDWLASFDEDRLEEIIADSIDVDWTPRDADRAIVRAMKGGQS